MGEYVLDIGRLLDVAWQAIQDGSSARIKARQEMQHQMRARKLLSIEKEDADSVCEPAKTFVYLMRHANGLTKIGRSKNPRIREKTLQAEDPRLEMIWQCEDNGEAEYRLHRIFESVRVRGEWFDLMPHHIEWITLVLKGATG